MSVSLREAQVTKILGNLLQGDKYDRDNFNSCLASILALFPPQLTEEEILQIITDWWEKEKKGKTLSDLSSALIGKCATPTFSGGEKDEMEQRKEIAKLLFKRKDMIPNNSMWLAAEIQDLFIPKPIPAEKKEFPISKCCNASVRISGIGDFHKTDEVCTQYYICCACNKPCDIAVEKKECEDCKFYEICNKVNSANRKCCGFQPKECEHEWEKHCGYLFCKKCKTTTDKEPKPKDRIEEVNFKSNTETIAVLQIGDKLNELIRHINKES